MGDNSELTTAGNQPDEILAGLKVQAVRNSGVGTDDPTNKEWILSDEENGGLGRPEKSQTAPFPAFLKKAQHHVTVQSSHTNNPNNKEWIFSDEEDGVADRPDKSQTASLPPLDKQEQRHGTVQSSHAFDPSSSFQPAQADQTDSSAPAQEQQQTATGESSHPLTPAFVFHHFSSSRPGNSEQQQTFPRQRNASRGNPGASKFTPFSGADMTEFLGVVQQHWASCPGCQADLSYLSGLAEHMPSCSECQAAFQECLASLPIRHDQRYWYADPLKTSTFQQVASIHMQVRDDAPREEVGYRHLPEGNQGPPVKVYTSMDNWANNLARDDGLYTLEMHEAYLSGEFENEGVEEGSELWWAIRTGRAQEAADMIFLGIGMAGEMERQDPRWQARSMTTDSAEAEDTVRLRGGAYPHVQRHDRHSKDRKDSYDRHIHGPGDGVMNRIWKKESLDVVGEEDDVVPGVAATEGRPDTTVVTEERLRGGGSQFSVSNRQSVSAGEGIVEEDFEIVPATGLANTNGSRQNEGKLHRHRTDGHRRPQDKDQDSNSSGKGGKRRSARNWLASWLPWRSAAPPTASKSIKNSAADVKMDGTRKRSSPKRPRTPLAQSSSSHAGGNKTGTMIHDEVAANKKNEPRTSTDQASHISSWSIVDDNSDNAKNSISTSDTSVESTHEDKVTTVQTQDSEPTTNDKVLKNEADTTAEPEKLDYASMVGEAGSYFYNPHGTDSGRKDKGVARDDDLVYRYHGYIRHARLVPYPNWLGEGNEKSWRHDSGPLPFPQRPWHHTAMADVEDRLGWSRSRDITSPAGGYGHGNKFEQSQKKQSHGIAAPRARHQRIRLPLDQTGPPPVPEERRHSASQAAAVVALNNGEFWDSGSGLMTPPGLNRPSIPPDIFADSSTRRDGETRLPSYAEVILQARRNETAKALEQAKKKPRFSLPALDIPRGLGRLVGRVIGHGEKEDESKMDEEEEEEGGVVEHKVVGGDSESSSLIHRVRRHGR